MSTSASLTLSREQLLSSVLTWAPVRWRRSAPLGPDGRPGRSQRPRVSVATPWLPTGWKSQSLSGSAWPPYLHSHRPHLLTGLNLDVSLRLTKSLKGCSLTSTYWIKIRFDLKNSRKETSCDGGLCLRTIGPGLVDGSLLVELLGQMFESLQTSDLTEDPFLVAFFCSFQSVPRSIDILRPNSRLVLMLNLHCGEQDWNQSVCLESNTTLVFLLCRDVWIKWWKPVIDVWIMLQDLLKTSSINCEYIQTPCVPLMAWRQVCCWASVSSAECWSWSPADISLGPEDTNRTSRLSIREQIQQKKQKSGNDKNECVWKPVVDLDLWWFVDAAVVSEVLLLCLHVIYSFLLGSVLQPGDGPTDPLQQLEANGKTRKNTSGTTSSWSAMDNLESGWVWTCWRVLQVLYSRHWPASRSPPSFARSPGWQPELCRYDLQLSQPIRKQSDERRSRWLNTRCAQSWVRAFTVATYQHTMLHFRVTQLKLIVY